MKSLVYLLAVLLVLASCKQQKNNMEVQKEEVKVVTEDSNQEWITLFDGTSLYNWRGYLSDSIYSEW